MLPSDLRKGLQVEIAVDETGRDDRGRWVEDEVKGNLPEVDLHVLRAPFAESSSWVRLSAGERGKKNRGETRVLGLQGEAPSTNRPVGFYYPLQ